MQKYLVYWVAEQKTLDLLFSVNQLCIGYAYICGCVFV